MKEKWLGFCRFVDSLHPVRMVVLGYLAYILAGGILLALPISHGSAPISNLDALFTSASAVSTTGLTTASTGQGFSLFGQLVILALIQVGGIGYMTFGSFVVLSGRGQLSERREQIGKVVFSMPEEFRIAKFIRSVIFFTVAVETAGVAALFAAFRGAGL